MASLSQHQVEAIVSTLHSCANANFHEARSLSVGARHRNYYQGKCEAFRSAARLIDELLQIEVAAEATALGGGDVAT